MSTKPLRRIEVNPLHHYEDGERRDGPNKTMSGDCSGLNGDCSGPRGDCSGLRGDCSGLRGDCSGLRGDCSGLRGNLDRIPASSRPCNISEWVEQ